MPEVPLNRTSPTAGRVARDAAGFTEMALHPNQPDLGMQQFTAVPPEHRGRGLGRCVKIGDPLWRIWAHHGHVIASVEQLVAVGLADAGIAAVVGGGDWYLVGSRAIGTADALSDWDTVVLRGEPTVAGQLSDAHLDRVFDVVRPRLSWPPDLTGHVRWRSAAGVEIEVLGPDARARREGEEGLAPWAHELRHAVLLRLGAGAGEQYRARIGERFNACVAQLAEQAYRGFRLARNQAAASLARPDTATQALTTARCVSQAARFWLLALGQPHPPDKWLLDIVGRLEGCGQVLEAMRAALDPGHGPDGRFDALWQLWRLVDEHAHEAAIDPELLAGSPFAA